MIILRKDKLNLVEPTDEVMNKPPAPYDFEAEGESAPGVASVLFERMKQLGGVGLSANQVGLNMRLFVMGVGETKIAIFNPFIIAYSKKEELFNEGCLSYPGIMLSIKRPIKITAGYQDETGKYVEQEFNGLTARVFQHEFDHMNGTDYTDRVSKFKLDFAKKKFENKRKKIIKKYAVKTMVEALNDSKDTNRI
jgi:peptide deformylase